MKVKKMKAYELGEQAIKEFKPGFNIIEFIEQNNGQISNIPNQKVDSIIEIRIFQPAQFGIEYQILLDMDLQRYLHGYHGSHHFRFKMAMCYAKYILNKTFRPWKGNVISENKIENDVVKKFTMGLLLPRKYLMEEYEKVKQHPFYKNTNIFKHLECTFEVPEIFVKKIIEGFI